MIERLTYLISTCKGYEAPLARLLASMPRDAHAIVVSGGHEARRVYYRNDRAHIEVPYTGYDYTALIEVVQGDWELSDHLFLLHDTMEMGPEADSLIRLADPALDSVAAWGGECNLCLYRADYLQTCRAQFRGLKNCSKLYAVEMEGFLWRQLPENRRGAYPGHRFESAASPAYIDGAPRRRIAYAGVDIVKYKANWGQDWPPAVVRP